MARFVNHHDTALSCCSVLSGEEIPLKKLDRYRGRALCITSREDIIQLPEAIHSGWDWIQNHYTSIGLEYTQDVIWDSSLRRLLEFPRHEISVFMFTPEIYAFRQYPDWMSLVQQMNSKNEFLSLCQELKVPTPKTIFYQSKKSFWNKPVLLGYPFFLKAAVSVSGLGVVQCKNQFEFFSALENIRPEEAFQLQETIPAEKFLNVQYVVQSDGLRLFAVTNQLLEGNSHNGNVFPSREGDAVQRVTSPIAEYLYMHGMRGYFAFDVAVVGDDYYVIECNPRFNGSTYPTIAAQKLGISSWIATNIHLKKAGLKDFSLGDLEYQDGSGVVVINWGCAFDGKLGILIAGKNQMEQEALLQEARDRL